jgi:Domain of unknown function (DUF4136)
MRYRFNLALAAIFLLGCSVAAFAGSVRTDYDHSVNFAQYKTYSWGKVQTSVPFYVSRIKQAVDKDLQAKGWQLAESGGSVMIFATDNVHDQKQLQTMYDGMGGGWGGGWGWGGWGWGGGWGPGGMGESTTTTTNQRVATLVIDLFDASSKKLLWRGLATQDLSTNSEKNTKSLDGDINNMFKRFPPKPGS